MRFYSEIFLFMRFIGHTEEWKYWNIELPKIIPNEKGSVVISSETGETFGWNTVFSSKDAIEQTDLKILETSMLNLAKKLELDLSSHSSNILFIKLSLHLLSIL